MPRGSKSKSTTRPDADKGDEQPGTSSATSNPQGGLPGAAPGGTTAGMGPGGPSFFESVEDAWHGWLKPVGGIVFVLLSYVLYDSKLLPEGRAGSVLIAAVIMGAIYGGIEPLLSRYTGRRNQLLIGALVLGWLVCAAGPVFRLVFPGEMLAQAELSTDKSKSTTEVKLPEGETGPYEIEVGGSIPGTGEAEASYALEITGDGGTSIKIDGAIKRTYFRQRTSRRGNASVSVRHEDTENLYRLGAVRGNKLTVNADIDGEKLESGLKLAVHRAGPNPIYFVAFGFFLMIFGIVLDYRLVAPKMAKTYIGMWIGFTLAFAAYFRFSGDANPANLVKPAVAAALFALPVGLTPAWLISLIVNSFKPRAKKLAGSKV